MTIYNCYKNSVKTLIQKPDTTTGAIALEVTSRPSWMRTCFDFEQIIPFKKHPASALECSAQQVNMYLEKTSKYIL